MPYSPAVQRSPLPDSSQELVMVKPYSHEAKAELVQHAIPEVEFVPLHETNLKAFLGKPVLTDLDLLEGSPISGKDFLRAMHAATLTCKSEQGVTAAEIFAKLEITPLPESHHKLVLALEDCIECGAVIRNLVNFPTPLYYLARDQRIVVALTANESAPSVEATEFSELLLSEFEPIKNSGALFLPISVATYLGLRSEGRTITDLIKGGKILDSSVDYYGNPVLLLEPLEERAIELGLVVQDEINPRNLISSSPLV